MKTSSFKLVSEIKSDESTCKIPVRKYVSKDTGMRLYTIDIDGPVVEGYFSLSTEATDDDGLPHTLEHMIFLGSEEYPYAGILDILANKVYASGTNAWTDTDNTTYTLSTVEKNGFLQLLPIYLDHIFYPLLNESGYITEVYHINGDGEDAGVVYSEMQSVENEDENIVERAIRRAIYPNEDCGYRYETGGILKNLRESTSFKKVCDYHKKMYRPDNMAIIVAGKIDPQEVIECLEKFEEKFSTKNPDCMKLAERPFSKPIESLSKSIEQLVYFPSDEEKTSNGIFTIAWRGPHINDMKHLIALDLLFGYLTDSTISPLQSHFINKKSYCNKISYQIEEYRETYVALSFSNAQLENLDKIKPDFDILIDDLVEKKTEFDMKRMNNLIKMKISEINDKFEDEPHQTASRICIGDFLHGSLENDIEFKQKFSQSLIFENLSKETNYFWLDLADRYVRQANYVAVTAKPCEKLMKLIGEQDKQRVEDRKKSLGKKGLKDLKIRVENAIEQNDETEVPESVYKSLSVPSLQKVEMKKIKQFFSYSNESEAKSFEPLINTFLGLENLKHLQMQVDHLEGTNFVQTFLFIDSVELDAELKQYLELFTNLLFELPIKHNEINLTHEEVVYQLNKDLLEYGASLGINGGQFEPGIFSEYLTVFTKVPVKDYELGVKWIKMVVFDSVFDKDQILIAASNLIKEVKNRKQQPFELMSSLSNDIHFKQESNLCMNNFFKQEKFLQNIHNIFSSENDRDTQNLVIEKLNEIKKNLLQDKKLRFYLCTDLNILNENCCNRKPEAVWLEHFSSNLLNNHSNKPIFVSNNPFVVQQMWKMKKAYIEHLDSLGNECKIFTCLPKKDYVISLGATESSYLRLVSSSDINSYHHSNYAALLVLNEYFCQTEGPLWEAVRGPGYCYSQSMHLNPEFGHFELTLNECSNLTKAYEATRNIFNKHHSNKNEFDPKLLETAKNSLIFLLIDDLKSTSSLSSFSMSCLFKDVDLLAVRELFKKIEKVEIKDLRKLLRAYVMPLFDDENSNCIIVCQPAKSEMIIQDFNLNFDRKLNLIGKLDECFCSLIDKN